MLRHRQCKPFRKRLRITLKATPKVGVGRPRSVGAHAPCVACDLARRRLLVPFDAVRNTFSPTGDFFKRHAIQSFDREARRVQGHTFVRTRPTDGSRGALCYKKFLFQKKGAVETNARDEKKKGKRRRKKDRRARRARKKKKCLVWPSI